MSTGLQNVEQNHKKYQIFNSLFIVFYIVPKNYWDNIKKNNVKQIPESSNFKTFIGVWGTCMA